MSEATEDKEFPFQFDIEFQKHIIRMMLLDDGFCHLSTKYLKQEYFESRELAWAYHLCADHYKKYKHHPTEIVLNDSIRDAAPQIRPIYEALINQITQVQCDVGDWVFDRVLEFVRRNIFFLAYQEVHALWGDNKHDAAYEFMSEKMDELNGIKNDRREVVDVVGELETWNDFRILQKDSAATATVPTGIIWLDKIFGGGVSPGEMILWLAYPKTGKSLCLTHMSWYAARHADKKVLHIPLEGTLQQCMTRFSARFSGELTSVIAAGHWSKEAAHEVAQEFEHIKGNLKVRKFNGWDSTAMDIRAQIKDLEQSEGFKPALLVADYLDLMKGSGKFYKSEWSSQMDAAREMKTLCEEGDGFALHSALQAQRPDKGYMEKASILRAADTGGSYDRARIADAVITINQTEDERLAGYVRLFVDIFRSGQTDGKAYLMKTDYGRSTFIDLQGQIAIDAEREFAVA